MAEIEVITPDDGEKYNKALEAIAAADRKNINIVFCKSCEFFQNYHAESLIPFGECAVKGRPAFPSEFCVRVQNVPLPLGCNNE